MAASEDAASVLEQFMHDVANLPAEVAHLYEEAQAKQDLINECNALIAARDGSLQKHVRQHGSLAAHPKEAVVLQSIREAYTKAATLQDEKVALVTKAGSLMDRYVKRLDMKIRDLQSEGLFPVDNNMPTLLRASAGNLVALPSAVTGAPGALQATSGNAGSRYNGTARPGATNTPTVPNISAAIANVVRANTAAASASGTTTPSGGGPDAKRRRLNASLIASLQTGNTLVTGPTRHASLGPGTPKAGTPGATSRAGSVGPAGAGRPSLKKTNTMPRRIIGGPGTSGIPHKKVRIQSQLGTPVPTAGPSVPSAVDTSTTNSTAPPAPKPKHPKDAKIKKKKKRLLSAPASNASTRASPSTRTEDEQPEKRKKSKSIKSEDVSEDEKDPDAMEIDEPPKVKRASASETSDASSSDSSSSEEEDAAEDNGEEEDSGSEDESGEDEEEEATEEEEEEEEEAEDGIDDTKYCYCQDVSHGDMIACDNADCPYQWVHLGCADLTEAPDGDWLCKDCKRLPKDKIRPHPPS